jgi:hypothetical protein
MPKVGDINNAGGANGQDGFSPSWQQTQQSTVKPVAPTQANARPLVQQRLAQAFRPASPANPHAARASELRAIAASAPPGLQHLALDLHRRADLMDRFGHDEIKAAGIVASWMASP